jgi:hypothetical protein
VDLNLRLISFKRKETEKKERRLIHEPEYSRYNTAAAAFMLGVPLGIFVPT